MKYESLQKMTVITGLLVFSLGICSYAEDKVSMMKEASLPKEKDRPDFNQIGFPVRP